MSLMAVPSQMPGAKSLPAEIKIPGSGNRPWLRMRAQSPSFKSTLVGRRTLGWMHGLGQDDSDSSVDLTSYLNSVTGADTGNSVDLSSGSLATPTDYSNLAASGDTIANPSVVPLTSSQQSSLNQILGQPGTAQYQQAVGTPPSGYAGPTVLGPNSATPSAPAGYQWASLLNSTGQTLAKVLAVSQGGSSVTLPNGAQLVYGSAASAAAGSLLGAGGLGTAVVGGLSLGTLLLLGGGLIVVMMLSSKGR